MWWTARMKALRLAMGLVLLAALGLVAAKAVCRLGPFPPAVACDASAIAAPYTHVDRVQSFGCVGTYAYLWVTVGHGVGEVSVTEVAHYDVATGEWRNVARLTYCADHRLPAYVRHWGCYSN